MSQIQLSPTVQKVFPILAFIGILDTLYLININNNPEVCTTNDSLLPIPIDCGSVAESQYSSILGIPLAFIGFLYYLSILLIFLFRDDLNWLPVSPIDLIGIIILSGFLVSLVLVYLQLFVIEAVCLYCMGSVVTTTVLGVVYFLYILRD